jgi:hypothetical protein
MSGEQFDDPNRQAVGLPPAWEEGTGGDTADVPPAPAPDTPETPPEPEAKSLDDMTKEELLAEAQARGLTPANAGMTKDEIRAVIDQG